MTVFALWSAPRARSTAFFRSMVERGDLVALHEPFYNLQDFGETDASTGAGDRVFTTPAALLAWLRDGPHDRDVFLKETTDHRHAAVLADRRFLAGARHAFLLRRPEEIAASYYALWPAMTINAVGLEAMHELHAAIGAAGGRSVVIDSDDLVARPAATLAAYCDAVGLPFRPEALTWEPGERPEWRRTARWHAGVSASSGLGTRASTTTYADTVETSDHLARFAAHHRPFYEALHPLRIDVTPWA